MKYKLSLFITVLLLISTVIYFSTQATTKAEFIHLESYLSQDFLDTYAYDASTKASLVLRYSRQSANAVHYIFVEASKQKQSTDYTTILNELIEDFPTTQNAYKIHRLTTIDSEQNYIDIVITTERLNTYKTPHLVVKTYYKRVLNDLSNEIDKDSYLHINKLLLQQDSNNSGLERVDYFPKYFRGEYERYDVTSSTNKTMWEFSGERFFESTQWKEISSLEYRYDPQYGDDFESAIIFKTTGLLGNGKTFEYSIPSTSNLSNE